MIVHDHLVRETIFYCKGDSGHSTLKGVPITHSQVKVVI